MDASYIPSSDWGKGFTLEDEVDRKSVEKMQEEEASARVDARKAENNYKIEKKPDGKLDVEKTELVHGNIGKRDGSQHRKSRRAEHQERLDRSEHAREDRPRDASVDSYMSSDAPSEDEDLYEDPER